MARQVGAGEGEGVGVGVGVGVGFSLARLQATPITGPGGPTSTPP